MGDQVEEVPLLQNENEEDALEFMPRTGPIDTWISYSSRNDAAVKSIMKELQKLGIKCWDHHSIMAGLDSLEAIGEATKRASKVVLMYSEEYAESQFCQLEKSMAFTLKLKEQERLRIFVVRLDDVTLPPEVDVLQYVRGNNRMSADIARDLAIAFATGVVPSEPATILNGESQEFKIPTDGFIWRKLYTSRLGSLIQDMNLQPIFEILHSVPLLKERRYYSYLWLSFMICMGVLFGIIFGFAIGGAHILAVGDAWHFYWSYSWYLALPFSIISPLPLVGHWYHERKKEREVLRSTLQKLNVKLITCCKLALYVDDDVTKLTFFKFDFDDCKEELQEKFPHLAAQIQDQTFSEYSHSEDRDAWACKDDILWSYIVAYQNSRIAAWHGSRYGEPTKHFNWGWKCFCQFVVDQYASSANDFTNRVNL